MSADATPPTSADNRTVTIDPLVAALAERDARITELTDDLRDARVYLQRERATMNLAASTLWNTLGQPPGEVSILRLVDLAAARMSAVLVEARAALASAAIVAHGDNVNLDDLRSALDAADETR